MKRASCALKSRFSKWKLKDEPGLREPRGSRKQKLAQDLLVCSGLELFCKDFCQSIEHTLRLFAKFWELMQVLDDEWFDEDGGVLPTHMWALRIGLGGVASPVCKQLQRHSKAVKALVEKLRDKEEVLQARDKAWIEREHYHRKLTELRSELSRRDQTGQAITAEQLERLQRNEAKNVRAQDAYEAIHGQAQAYRAAKEDLKGVLCDVVRTVACGWFISVGAGVCRAVSEAESAQRGAASGPGSGGGAAGSSGLRALPAWPSPAARDGGGGAPRAEGEAEPEGPEPFDPADPFKGSWRCESIGSEGEDESSQDSGSVLEVERPAEGADGALAQRSTQELRQLLAERGLGVPPWCAERPALLELIRTLDSQASPASSSMAGARTPAHRSSGSGQQQQQQQQQQREAGSLASAREEEKGAHGNDSAGGGVDSLRHLTDADLREMLAASGGTADAVITRAQLVERLLRSQGLV